MPVTCVEDRKVLAAKHVAELIGKSSRTIRRWSQTSEHNFPKPFIAIGHPRWRQRDILKWIYEHGQG